MFCNYTPYFIFYRPLEFLQCEKPEDVRNHNESERKALGYGCERVRYIFFVEYLKQYLSKEYWLHHRYCHLLWSHQNYIQLLCDAL